jgi:hypothetical protein
MLSDSVDRRWLDLLGVDPTGECSLPRSAPGRARAAPAAAALTPPAATVADDPAARPVLRLAAISAAKDDLQIPLPRRVRPRSSVARRAGRRPGWINRVNRIWLRPTTWLDRRTRLLQLTALALAVVVSLLGLIVWR